MRVRNVEWVVKISKFCNLRCAYCYEYPFLANRERMSLRDLANMFRNIAEFYAPRPKRMDFVWHGGEPLLVEKEYYDAIRELQFDAFEKNGIPFSNSVQTNLTLLDDKRLEFLRSGFFGNVGVSIDLFGDQRVNVGGEPVEKRVLTNMQRLVDAGIEFGCITVLSRVTAPHVGRIYSFFEDIDTSFRLLPVYRTGYVGQQDLLALDHNEIVTAFRTAVDRWFASKSDIQVRPIQDYIAHALWKLEGAARANYYDKLEDEVVYIINTDGSLFSVADPPDMSLSHGNIFTTPLSEMKRSRGYLSAARAAHRRMTEACGRCEYHGFCSGYFMAEATPEQRHFDDLGQLRCVAQSVQRYIENVLLATGVYAPNRGFAGLEEIRSRLIPSGSWEPSTPE